MSTLIPKAWPDGHFYSPIVDSTQIDGGKLWPKTVTAPVGIDWRSNDQKRLIEDLIVDVSKYDYPDHASDPHQFASWNGAFEWMDARVFFTMLRRLQPRRVIEVGSGHSSLLLADVRRRFFPNMQITCIDPEPTEFLRAAAPTLLATRVETLPFDLFNQLEDGDLLFIDSSHVCKTGSDVNYLYLEVLPRLRLGVVVHVHDIFLPYEYPEEWVRGGVNWNEQYLLRALLIGSSMFQVLFGCAYARAFLPEETARLLDHRAHDGGSFYMQRLG